MDFERNCENKEPSFSSSSVTNATFSEFLAKHDFNAIAEMLKLDSQKSDKTKEFYNTKSKDSTNTYGEVSRANVGENLQQFSVKRNNSELSDHSDINSDAYVGKHYSDHSKNTVQAKYSFSSLCNHYGSSFSGSKKIDNLNNYPAEMKAECHNRVTFKNEEQVQGSSKSNFPHTSCAEKTTYCRPVYNVYHKEFVNKTIEKNIKLQKLLKKIVLARKRETEKEKWNNYVNELKNKHSYYSNQPRHILPQYVPRESMYPGPMYDFYNTKYSWNNPKHFGSLVHDVYGYSDAPPHEYYYSSDYERACENPRLNHLYQNEQYCFPTSSQGRFMIMQKDRIYPKMPYHTQFHKLDTPIVIDREINHKKIQNHTEFHRNVTPKVADREVNLKTTYIPKRNNIKTKVSDTLEDCGCSPIGEINRFFKEKPKQNIGVKTSGQRIETTKEKYDRVTENVKRLKEKLENNEQKIHQKSSISLKIIETKLDALITSLNCFMAEMKSKKDSTSPSLTPIYSIESSDNSRESSLPPRDSSCFGTKKKSVIIVGNATNTSTGVLQSIPIANSILRHATATTKINNILDEERDKSNKLRREIEELLPTKTNRPCVQITFDIPTKERATEVTNSLSKTKLSSRNSKVNEVIEELIAPNRHRKMTIAVNTDPLGLLALFRISSEAIKQLMSYVDYNWYFSMLPLRHVEKSGISDYVCNICGDAFARPSQLSDHIKRHKLGNAKNCCVCRHALDTKRCCSSLFGCQYCGQVFTRAYCCELHQQTCARSFGRKHDASSSLVMLS